MNDGSDTQNRAIFCLWDGLLIVFSSRVPATYSVSVSLDTVLVLAPSCSCAPAWGTEALHALEPAQIIRAEGRNIVVRDRGKLEQVAGDSYGLREPEHERLIGSLSQAELHMEPELLMGHTTAAAVRRVPLHNLSWSIIIPHLSKPIEKRHVNTFVCSL